MASHGLPESAKPADNCGSYRALQEHVADGLGLGGGAAAGKRATASWVDLDIGDSLFGEKEQARLLAGEQLPCLLCLLDKLTLCKP